MTRQVNLTVNDVPIKLDYFAEEYVDHVVGGIVSSLRGTGEIRDLEMAVDNGGRVRISLNGEDVSLKKFPVLIIKSTLDGMVAPLRGVDGPVDRLNVTISR